MMYVSYTNKRLWRGVDTLVFAEIAQLGERQTEDLKVPGSIPGLGNCYLFSCIVDCYGSSD